MSRPLRIHCPSSEDIPTTETILRLVADDQHLVLQLPAGSSGEGAENEPRAIIEELSSALPDCTVFQSLMPPDGMNYITIQKVISEQQVLANAERIVSAAQEFRRLAAELMLKVARRLSVPPEAFADRFFRFQLDASDNFGDLEDDWQFWFHGGECRLSNERTGQTVEVRLGFGAEFGVLDPWFFHKFVSTTPALQGLATLLKDGYHDPLRAFEVLERHGPLRRIASPTGEWQGWIAPNPQPKANDP